MMYELQYKTLTLVILFYINEAVFIQILYGHCVLIGHVEHQPTLIPALRWTSASAATCVHPPQQPDAHWWEVVAVMSQAVIGTAYHAVSVTFEGVIICEIR